MKYILISILIIILIVLISKNKEKFAIFYNKDDNDDKEKSYEVSLDLPNRLEYSLLSNDDINNFKKIESTMSDKKDYKIEQIQKHIEKSSETTLKDNIKLNLQNDADFMRSIKGNQGPRGESGISDINTDVIAKNLKINDKILNREHVNYIKDYHNGDLESLYGNQIDIRKDKKAIDQSLTDGLYTDTLNIGELDNLDQSLAIRNELDAIQIDKLNANIMNINNNNIYSKSPNGINIDKLKVTNLNVQDGLKVDGKSIFEILKGEKGEKGDQGEISVLPDKSNIEGNKLNLVYSEDEDNNIIIGETLSQLKGPQGDQGPKGDIGRTGDPFDLPTNITTTDNVLTIEDKNNSFNVEGVKGDQGPDGYQGDRGDQGDHGLYPISVEKNGDELTFKFNDSNNITTSLPLDSYKGDLGFQGYKGDDGINIYADSLNYDENNSIIEFTKNITFDDTNLKFNKKNFNYANIKDINSYMINLARYLEMSIDDIYVKSNAYNDIKTQLKTDLESNIETLLGKIINIYDFYFQEIEIEGNNYKIEKILDIAKILNIGINDKTQLNIVTQIKTLGQKFTDKTLFEKIIKDIEDNKEFIYIYKSFGNKLYFDPKDLSLEEMNKFFDNMGYLTLKDIKDNLKTISNIIYKVNIIEDNKFFYKMVNSKYKADDFKTKIDTLFNIFKLDGYYTLDEKLYVLNNFKLGHDQDCVDKEKCEKYCMERLDKDAAKEKYNKSYKCINKITKSTDLMEFGGGSKTVIVNTIPDITNIYPNLDDLTADAIFEINANKQTFLEDKLIVDFKSRLIFKMKNSDKIVNDIKTQKLKSQDIFKYWDLTNNYLETSTQHKLQHLTTDFTQIFVVKLDSLNDINFLNYASLDGDKFKETEISPLKISNSYFINKYEEKSESIYGNWNYVKKYTKTKEIISKYKNKWVFLVLTHNKSGSSWWGPYRDINIYLHTFDDKFVSWFAFSEDRIDLTKLYYHRINKPNSNLGKLSMIYTFNKSLSIDRIQSIFNKIKEDYF